MPRSLLPIPAFSQRARFLTTLTVVLSLVACSDSSTRPKKDPDLRLSLIASARSGNPANPISFSAVAWNAGGGDVSYYSDCCHDPVGIVFMDASGVAGFDNAPVCRCAETPHVMPPAPVGTSSRFGAPAPGPALVIPPGRYTAVALFRYRVEPEGEMVTLREAVPFDWFAN